MDRERWDRLFERQKAFVSKSRPSASSAEDRRNRMLLALAAEVGELIQASSADWKWWRARNANSQAVVQEVVDVFLMALAAAVELGVSRDELLALAESRLARLEGDK